eukprot:3550829-Rhodomonas_salina.2
MLAESKRDLELRERHAVGATLFDSAVGELLTREEDEAKVGREEAWEVWHVVLGGLGAVDFATVQVAFHHHHVPPTNQVQKLLDMRLREALTAEEVASRA